jgi:hypothetical protein
MPRCPFATWLPISGSSGPHLGGPFKIVHHTTEGSTAEGALRAFANRRSDPHFTVDSSRILQHIDTSEGARALVNEIGGVQTNRDSAIQIELVGFAHLPKDPQALANVARLCRWIESVHGVAREWPAGLPRQALNGRDPGGHNRDAQVWDSRSGHYGHCHVPENTHWDPGYSESEVAFLMNATFDGGARLTSAPLTEPPPRRATRGKSAAARSTARARSTMVDHSVVPTGTRAYIRDLRVLTAPFMSAPGTASAVALERSRRRAPSNAKASEAKVDVGSVMSFVGGVGPQARDDVLYSVQLAQLGASGAADRFTQPQAWYLKYVEILGNLGWASEQFAFTLHEQGEGEFRMDKAALAIITAIATQNQLAVLQQSITALSKLAEKDNTISLFEFHSSLEASGNFQLGTVQVGENGALSMAMGAFHFRAVDERRRFLFFKWGSREVNFWTAAQRMTLNQGLYARNRQAIIDKLAEEAGQFIADLKLAAR